MNPKIKAIFYTLATVLLFIGLFTLMTTFPPAAFVFIIIPTGAYALYLMYKSYLEMIEKK